MFDLGWTELLLIGIVALIVVGPKELPGMFRKMGQFTGKARAMARDFQRAMDSAADETGVKDIQRDFRKMTSTSSLGVDDLDESIKSGLNAADFTKDWEGNPLQPAPETDKTTDKTAGTTAGKTARKTGGAAKKAAKAPVSKPAKIAPKTSAAPSKSAKKAAPKQAAAASKPADTPKTARVASKPKQAAVAKSTKPAAKAAAGSGANRGGKGA